MRLDWATRRQLTYLSIIAAVVFIIASIGLFWLLYEEPTCSDGAQNQGENGVDCGGPCPSVCPDEAVQPLTLWSRAFPVSEGTYNVVARVENPNNEAHAFDVGYEFNIYDKDGVLMRTIEGTTYIPVQQTFSLFEGRLSFEREPARVTIDFDDDIAWKQADESDAHQIEVESSQLSSLEAAPRVQATIRNTGISPVSNLEAVAIVYDQEDVAVGASRTTIDSIQRDEQRDITFTWPRPFQTGTRICSQPANTMLVMDRSGSMNDDNEDPPQPLTAVKGAATNFLDQLANTDRAGLVSFATEASDPIDQQLTGDFTTLKDQIENITIGDPDSEQHTNIADGITKAVDELSSERRDPDATGMIVLLTDGIATRPRQEGQEDYPQQAALEAAQEAAENNFRLYVIGLGDDVNNDFLRTLPQNEDQYYHSPTVEDLDTIYSDVATSICRKGAAVTRIDIRDLPDD